MGTVRTIVFPTLRLLVWIVIAVCLVYIAFFRGGPDAAGTPATPSASITAPETTVTRADVVNTVTVSGSISEDPATTVKSTAAGTVGKLRVGVGDLVDEGAPLFTVVVPVEEEEPATAPADPAAPVVPATPRTRTVSVRANATGTVATLDVLPQQSVEVGSAVATISPGTLTATAPLTQNDQFRLLSAPTVAKVTVPGGPGTFDCTDLRTGRPAQGAGGGQDRPQDFYGDPGMGMDPGSTPTGANVTCRVPEGVQVFPGVTAEIEITAGEARGVLVAPVTAVRGTIGTGSLWVLDGTGAETETQVTLGLTDGENVEIRSGVEEGTRILQFVPDSDEVLGDPGMEMHMGMGG